MYFYEVGKATTAERKFCPLILTEISELLFLVVGVRDISGDVSLTRRLGAGLPMFKEGGFRV